MHVESIRKNALLIAMSIVVLSAFILLFLVICFSLVPIKSENIGLLVGLSIPTIISMWLFPMFCTYILRIKTDIKQCRKGILISCLWMILFITIYCLLYSGEFESEINMMVIIGHYIIVSIGEEFTYRRVVLDILNTRYASGISILLSAVMFSFILHLNENILVNIAIRFPIGIVLGYIATKTRTISYTVLLHTIYNLLVFII